MANTPQAKKRIRRNERRAVINGNRVSRIRTFVKKVEAALAAGDKETATVALAAAQPEMARGVAKGASKSAMTVRPKGCPSTTVAGGVAEAEGEGLGVPGVTVTGGVFPVSSGPGPLPEQARRATGRAASNGIFIIDSPGGAIWTRMDHVGPMGR